MSRPQVLTLILCAVLASFTPAIGTYFTLLMFAFDPATAIGVAKMVFVVLALVAMTAASVAVKASHEEAEPLPISPKTTAEKRAHLRVVK